jgi:YVTN family beta-propeller protein
MARLETSLSVIAVIVLLILVSIGAAPLGGAGSTPLRAGPRVLDNATSNLSLSILSPSTPVAGTLVDRGTVGALSPVFWSIVGQTANNWSFDTDSSVGKLLNSTPINFIRYGQDSDACDVANNKWYTFENGHLVTPGCEYNISAFKAWCYSLTPHCHSILTLPGEVKNASTVDWTEANYIVNTIHFQPDYWAIGNEPENWEHYNISWPNWQAADSSTTNASDYAWVVNSSITSVRTVPGLSSAQFVGIEAASSSSTAYFQDVAKAAGTRIAAVAYHSYPDWNGSSKYYPLTLAHSYMPLMYSSRNISGSLLAIRSAIAGQCTGCSSLPIQVGEYNGGPSAGKQWMNSSSGVILYTNATPYDSRFQGAVFTAASLAQAIDAQVQTLSYFDLQSGGHNYSLTNFSYAMSNNLDARDPVAILYQSMLPYMSGGTVNNVAIRTTLGNVWAAMLSSNGSDGAVPVSHDMRASLLVVNANLNSSLSLNLNGVLNASMSGRIISWNNTTASPVSRWGSFNTSFTIPSQGILVLNGSLCASCLSVNLSAGSKPDGFAVSGANDMTYVAESGAHAVVAISATGAATSVSVPSCGHPSELAYSPATTYIYVSCANSSKVVAISPSNGVVQTIAVGSAPGAIAYDPANDDILVANYGSDTVSAISGVTVVKTISVGSGPTSITYDVTNSFVYTTNSQSSNLTVMNATLVKLASPSTAADPISAVVDSVGDVIVICNSSSSVRVFSGTSSTHTIALPSGSHPSAAAWEVDSSLVVITEYSRNTLAVLSTGNWSVFTSISAPAGPNAIVWDAIDSKLYVTCFLANSVFEVFVTIGFADLAAGQQPVAVSWNPYYDAVGVAERGSGDVWWSAS